MVVHIPEVFLQKIVEEKEKITVLKLLFYLFENHIHDLLLTEKEDLQLFNRQELKVYREYVVKKAVRDSVRRTKSRYIVQLYPDREALSDVVKRIRESGLDAHVRTVIPGARYVVQYRQKTYDLIVYELIKTFVGSPLKILVENIRSDKLFLQTVIKFIGGLNPDDLYIEYLHGGGSTILQVADEYKGKARIFCLIDGDEVAPGEYLHPDKKTFKQSVIQLCNKYGYQYHVLSKREIENYIPDEALERMGFQRHQYLYFHLPEEHKDYFDMKEGLTAADLQYRLWKELYRRLDEVAATVNREPGTKGAGKQGRGKNRPGKNRTGKKGSGQRAPKLKIEGFGRTVYTAFEYVMSKEELERRDRRGELRHLLKKLLDIV